MTKDFFDSSRSSLALFWSGLDGFVAEEAALVMERRDVFAELIRGCLLSESPRRGGELAPFVGGTLEREEYKRFGVASAIIFLAVDLTALAIFLRA